MAGNLRTLYMHKRWKAFLSFVRLLGDLAVLIPIPPNNKTMEKEDKLLVKD